MLLRTGSNQCRYRTIHIFNINTICTGSFHPSIKNTTQNTFDSKQYNNNHWRFASDSNKNINIEDKKETPQDTEDIPPVPTFVPPPPSLGESRRNPVGLGEPVLEGTAWVLEGNRWYLNKDSVNEESKRISLPHRRGRDKMRGMEKTFPNANKDLPLSLRIMDMPKLDIKPPKTVNWRETPAVTRRRVIRKQMTELRKRAGQLWKAIEEERKEREKIENEEMERHKEIRRKIREEEKRISSSYQKEWIEHKKALKERVQQQHVVFWKKAEEIKRESRREWLASLDKELYRVPNKKLKDIKYIFKNQRYATWGGKEWYSVNN